MNKNKYPSLEWCEKYGHLFPESDLVIAGIGTKYNEDGSIELASLSGRAREGLDDLFTLVANYPDALEIMDWLWKKHEVYILPTSVGFYSGDKTVQRPMPEAKTHLEALLQAVELVAGVKG